MPPLPRPLFVLHSDPRFRARLRQAAGRTFAVAEAESWQALTDALRSASLAALAVVDPCAGRATPGLAPELNTLLRAFSTTTVIAAVDARVRFSDLRALGKWGVAELISVEEDDAAAIARLLQSVRGRPLQSVLERALPENASGRTREVLSAAAEVAADGGGAEELARSLFVSMRTLHRRCEAAGVPPPRQTLAWMRILLAAELLEQPGRSIEDVATACGYATDSGLRRAFYDFLEMSPTQARRAGAVVLAAAGFRRALAAHEAVRPGAGGGVIVGAAGSLPRSDLAASPISQSKAGCPADTDRVPPRPASRARSSETSR
jgi:AraC-like DNA-binding protein